MSLRYASALALSFASLPAFAASDLTTSITQPTGDYVYDMATWSVQVSNIGNKSASNVSLTITLPQTNTSPTVYVMGTVGTLSSGCTRSSNVITCAMGTIARSTSKTATFQIALPQSDGTLDFASTVSTTSSENSTTNNSDSEVASLLYYSNPLSGDTAMVNDHCTGTGLEAYYECTLFPSSISSHSTTLNADGSISFGPEGEGYTGAWDQPTSDTLTFYYVEPDGVTVAAEFVGDGVPGGCFEGLTTFPGSSYVSPYSVCPE